ncbi:hypothetical protein SETIT_1G038700v2 [Setaria italica]|uniref:Uncharacterized protein n=2 Tax=Setaria TaxID=4554 RepID=A0A368PH50_SETIT|nr:hypothetical protein SETIT_1G038700v2 [Setaria italica]TKW37299.1 hypothetical protein SEVIR_1G037900v2 [Setaria viridis]TKW37300.1 hypothetical protein SEVIR_1G037900v2 [Setaria viridis]
MSMSSGAVHFLAILCFSMAVLMAIGSIVVDAYCESPNAPGPHEGGSCTPAAG